MSHTVCVASFSVSPPVCPVCVVSFSGASSFSSVCLLMCCEVLFVWKCHILFVTPCPTPPPLLNRCWCSKFLHRRLLRSQISTPLWTHPGPCFLLVVLTHFSQVPISHEFMTKQFQWVIIWKSKILDTQQRTNMHPWTGKIQRKFVTFLYVFPSKSSSQKQSSVRLEFSQPTPSSSPGCKNFAKFQRISLEKVN